MKSSHGTASSSALLVGVSGTSSNVCSRSYAGTQQGAVLLHESDNDETSMCSDVESTFNKTN
jgi:hypothetical protein